MNTSPSFHTEIAQHATRRWFMKECGVGLAGMALHSLFAKDASAISSLSPQRPHYPPRAKRVGYLFHAGAPSQLELFDPKPELNLHDGKLPPAELLEGYRAAFINPNLSLIHI